MAEEANVSAGWHYARDGQEAGPVGLDALRGLAASGGLRPGDLVWTAGMAQWAPAGSVPALNGAFGSTAAPPPLPAPATQYPPGGGGGIGVGGPPFAHAGVPLAYGGPMTDVGGPDEIAHLRWLIPVGRSGWAIAAGYLGLLSVLGCVGPIAIIVSLIAIQDVRKNPRRRGMGRAIFGLVMGSFGTLALVAFFAGYRFR